MALIRLWLRELAKPRSGKETEASQHIHIHDPNPPDGPSSPRMPNSAPDAPRQPPVRLNGPILTRFARPVSTLAGGKSRPSPGRDSHPCPSRTVVGGAHLGNSVGFDAPPVGRPNPNAFARFWQVFTAFDGGQVPLTFVRSLSANTCVGPESQTTTPGAPFSWRPQAGLRAVPQDTFLRELDAELAAEAASRVEAPDPTPPPDKPAPPPTESREDRIARVIREIDAMAAKHEDAQQRERNELVERYRRELKARPQFILMREALDKQPRLDPPAPRREPPRDPAGYMPLGPSRRPHPRNS